MFLRCTTRKKNGKEHHYYSLVESRRLASGRVIQHGAEAASSEKGGVIVTRQG